MYAAHLAAGLAIKGSYPKVPTAAVLTAVFLPDLFWLVLAIARIEPVDPGMFFDGWSHSVLSIVVQSVFFGVAFLRLGRGVALAIAIAVLSHLLLDLPIHPLPLELYPHAQESVGVFFKSWGAQASWLGKSHNWWVEMDVTVSLLTVYAATGLRTGLHRNIVLASCFLVAWLQILFG